jgi:hypothetical protein
MSFPENLHLFCRVVANFGDIGVYWRQAPLDARMRLCGDAFDG